MNVMLATGNLSSLALKVVANHLSSKKRKGNKNKTKQKTSDLESVCISKMLNTHWLLVITERQTNTEQVIKLISVTNDNAWSKGSQKIPMRP